MLINGPLDPAFLLQLTQNALHIFLFYLNRTAKLSSSYRAAILGQDPENSIAVVIWWFLHCRSSRFIYFSSKMWALVGLS
jgi:hypothetical protein